MLRHPINKNKEEVMSKEYDYIGKKLNTRYVIAVKENGCKGSKRLETILSDVLEGDFDDQITKIVFEKNPEDYNAVIEAANAKKTPVIVDLETGKSLAGLKLPKLGKFLMQSQAVKPKFEDIENIEREDIAVILEEHEKDNN